MASTPTITITRLDLQRLEQMLDELEDFGAAAQTLHAELARAEVVGHGEVPAGVVTMNSRVHCREQSSGTDYHLTVVYPHETGPEGNVSVLAPVGTALLGLSVGQTIDWALPNGKVLNLELLAVEYQPEAAGEYSRN